MDGRPFDARPRYRGGYGRNADRHEPSRVLPCLCDGRATRTQTLTGFEMAALKIGPDMMRAASDGDRKALAQLLAIAQPDIRRFAKRTCRSSSDVDDAVQEALWLLTRRVGTLRAVGSFSAWLFAIVRRECLRLARRLRPNESLDDHANDLIAQRSDADLRLDLSAALQSLPEHYRSVILLRDVEELTVGEIAGALGLTREATKARLHRARGLVREYLVR
jgi:RNA polymerase sigma factor (sigma-70 family)